MNIPERAGVGEVTAGKVLTRWLHGLHVESASAVLAPVRWAVYGTLGLNHLIATSSLQISRF